MNYRRCGRSEETGKNLDAAAKDVEKRCKQKEAWEADAKPLGTDKSDQRKNCR